MEKWIRRLSEVLALVVFVAAIIFIRHLSHRYTASQILDALSSLPVHAVINATLATIGSYAVLTCYDIMGLRYIKAKVAPGKAVLASFIAFSMTNNIGLANLAGNSIRLRMYSNFGLSPKQILSLIVFISFSFWTGFLGLIGGLFLFNPPAMPEFISIPVLWIRLIGLLLLVVPFGYLYLCYFKWTPAWLTRFGYSTPSWRMAVLQIVVSAVEWALAGIALYSLLPEHVTGNWLGFLSVFGLAQFLALLSHVPGGIGVLEATVIYFISPAGGTDVSALGALLAFRIIYYFAPFALSTGSFVVWEIYKSRRSFLPNAGR